MVTSLLSQALEFHTLIWRKGPYVRFPFRWNPQTYLFETEESSKRKLPWFFSSIIFFAFLFVLLMFLVTVGLKVPHNDKLENWILAFDLLPLVTYILLNNWKVYSMGPSNYIFYHNLVTTMTLENIPRTRYNQGASVDKTLAKMGSDVLRGNQNHFINLQK